MVFPLKRPPLIVFLRYPFNSARIVQISAEAIDTGTYPNLPQVKAVDGSNSLQVKEWCLNRFHAVDNPSFLISASNMSNKLYKPWSLNENSKPKYLKTQRKPLTRHATGLQKLASSFCQSIKTTNALKQNNYTLNPTYDAWIPSSFLSHWMDMLSQPLNEYALPLFMEAQLEPGTSFWCWHSGFKFCVWGSLLLCFWLGLWLTFGFVYAHMFSLLVGIRALTLSTLG